MNGEAQAEEDSDLKRIQLMSLCGIDLLPALSGLLLLALLRLDDACGMELRGRSQKPRLAHSSF